MATDWKEAVGMPVFMMDEDGRVVGIKDFNGRYWNIPQTFMGTTRPIQNDPDVAGVGSGSSSTWGTLIGNISNQGDLQSALDEKADLLYTDAQLANKVSLAAYNTQVALLATLDSPTFTGDPQGVTKAPGDSDNSLATTAFVQQEIAAKANLNSPTFSGIPAAPTAITSTNTTQIANTAFVQAVASAKANISSPSFTGVPTAPTPVLGTNSQQLATCDWVQSTVAPKAPTASPTFTGIPAAPTAALGTNTTQLATTAFVKSAVDAINVTPPAWGNISGTLANQADLNTALAAKAATTYVDSQNALKSNIASPAFTGVPTAPTATAGTNTVQLATTAFVTTAVAAVSGGGGTWGGITGTLSAQTDLNTALNARALASRTINSQPLTADVTLTKSDVGLGFVDNTSDVNKPVSSATQTALNLKSNLASPTFTGTPAAPTAAPGTNTTQLATTAFVAAAVTGVAPTWGNLTGTLSNQTDLNNALNAKVPTTRTINGYDLSANRTLVKADFGLGNVDNTSDVNKPVSTAQQTAIDLKGNVTLLTVAQIAAPTTPQLQDRRAVYIASDDGGFYRRYRSNGLSLVEVIDSIDMTEAYNRQSGRLEMSRSRSAYRYASTASFVASSVPREFVGIFIESQSAADTITVYDNASAASGTILLQKASPAVGTWYEIPVPVSAINGLYVSIANAGTKTLSIKRSE